MYTEPTLEESWCHALQLCRPHVTVTILWSAPSQPALDLWTLASKMYFPPLGSVTFKVPQTLFMLNMNSEQSPSPHQHAWMYWAAAMCLSTTLLFSIWTLNVFNQVSGSITHVWSWCYSCTSYWTNPTNGMLVSDCGQGFPQLIEGDLEGDLLWKHHM